MEKCPGHHLFSAMFFMFCWVILLFKMAPNHSAEVSFRVPKYTKADCLVEKYVCLNKLCSVMS